MAMVNLFSLRSTMISLYQEKKVIITCLYVRACVCIRVCVCILLNVQTQTVIAYSLFSPEFKQKKNKCMCHFA